MWFVGVGKEVDVHTLKWEIAQISQYLWSDLQLFLIHFTLNSLHMWSLGNARYIFLVKCKS